MHEVGGIVVAHRDLFEYDAALHIDVMRRHGRVQHDIDDDIDGKRQIPIEYRRVVAGVLLLGECVQLATNGIHRGRDLQSGARRRALEQEMLEKVARARDRGRLMARSDWDPDSDACAADAGHRLADYPQPGRQRRPGDRPTPGCRDAGCSGTRLQLRLGHQSILRVGGSPGILDGYQAFLQKAFGQSKSGHVPEHQAGVQCASPQHVDRLSDRIVGRPTKRSGRDQRESNGRRADLFRDGKR